jgi:tetratricopeptide (TPR) repeat protein
VFLFARSRAETPAAAAAPATSPSEDEIAAAQRHFQSGAEFFQRGNYEAARLEFESAYQLSKYPQLLFNLAKTAEKLNRTADLIRYLEEYLASNPPAEEAGQLREKLAALKASNPAPAGTASAAPVTTTAGAQPKKPPPIGAIVLLGAGAGVLAVGIGFGIAAIQPGNAPSQETAYNGVSITCDVVGGLSIAAGAAWMGYWLYQRYKKPAQQAPAVSFVPTRSGGGLALSF